MARTGPTTLTLPPFAGATRRLILWNLAAFFGYLLLATLTRGSVDWMAQWLPLQPAAVAHGQLWRLLTYAFLPLNLPSTLFALLTLWFVGDMLESAYGARWLYELYFTSAIGGALLASAISFTHLFGLDPATAAAAGPNAALFGLLIAVGVLFGDQEFLLLFLVRVKARYLVAIYLLIQLATLLSSGAFRPMVLLSGALCGYLFLRFAPRRGLAFLLSERLYGLRNAYYRSKRRQAAKKFEVYMGKQGREVRFDRNGKYIEPEDRDPNDKRWMN